MRELVGGGSGSGRRHCVMSTRLVWKATQNSSRVVQHCSIALPAGLAHISLSWGRSLGLKLPLLHFFHHFFRCYFTQRQAPLSAVSCRPIQSRMIRIPQLLPTSRTSAAQGRLHRQRGQTASKALGLRFNEKNDLRKTHIRRHTTVANYKTYYLAMGQACFLISADGWAHSCFRFVLFLSSCSESPFVMSVTEDKTNTYWVNMTPIPPAVGKQINMGSEWAGPVNPLRNFKCS